MTYTVNKLREIVDGIVEGLNQYSGDIEEFIEGVLDVKYVLNSNFELEDVILVLSLGGPNVYLHLKDGVVEGYWWDSYYSRKVENEKFIDSLWEYFESIVKERLRTARG